MKPSTQTRGRAAGIVALAASLALVATGCSSGSGSNDSAGDSQRELITRAPGGGSPVDQVTWNLPNGEPPTLDPRNTADYSGLGVVSNLCDTLLVMDENYEISPNLVSFEQTSPTEVVLTLVADAKFWNGNPVTTEDIVYSLQRAAAEDSIVAFYFANVTSMEATDDTHVTIELSQTDVLFNASLATFGSMITEKAFTEQAGDAFGSSSGGLMCSGPYKLDSWTPGDKIEISKNEDYWNKDLPSLADQVTFQFISDSTAATTALTTGEVDGSYEIPASSIPSLEESGTGQVFFGPSMQSIGMSVARPDGPLADLDLRQALQTLIDRQALADVVFHGAATPLYTSLTPATWPTGDAEHQAYQEAYDGFAEQRAFDVEKSKSLVEQSSYDGTPIVLGIPAGDDTQSRIAQLLQQQAKEVGVTIDIVEMQPLDATQAGYDAAVREKFGLDLMISNSFNIAHEPLEPMSFAVIKDSPYNYTNFYDPRAEELAAQAKQTTDEAARAEMILELQDILEADNSGIPLLSTNTVTFLNNRLGGAITSFAYISMPQMAYIGAN